MFSHTNASLTDFTEHPLSSRGGGGGGVGGCFPVSPAAGFRLAVCNRRDTYVNTHRHGGISARLCYFSFTALDELVRYTAIYEL